MSTTIDQRVVEMRFDNKHFESNVSTTMSTLDKLKQKLHLDGATKGLENVNTAAKKVDFADLGRSVDQVGVRFSAMQVVATTALANITNSAVNAGKNIVKALTITPVTTGLDEYETKMGSIQTILANTEHQGTTMDDVTAALQELNLYADKTIYNFQEMTRNIGTFTAAGVDLDTSVKSIQGIANLAAVSGSTSQQASTAMYQLSQALATGTVKLMDWNSVVNAGMGGKVFQNALIRTAAMLDGAAQDVEAWQAENVDAFGSFRDSLTQGAWLTGEVLTETLKQFTMAAEEGTEEWEAYKKSLMDQGYAEAQAEEILKMANTATDAATKVKTFTQLFDTLKESAQSGWAQTWELIFGDFEEAKEFFSGLSDTIGGLINSMSDYRNNLLGGVLDSNWDKLVSKINEAGIKTTDFEEKIRELYDNDKELDKLIEQFGSLEKAIKAGKIPADLLKKALESFGISTSKTESKIAGFVEGLKDIKRMLGFGAVGDDVKKLQTALEELGHSVGEHGIDGIIGPDTQKAIMEFQKAAGIAVDGVAGPETLAALEKAGKSVENIAEGTTEAAVGYDELIDSITQKGGRELFLEGFSNAVKGLIGVFKALGAAWTEIFPADGIHTGLLKAIEAFNNFSKSLLLTEEVVDENGNAITKFNENGEKLVRIFKGAFAAVDALLTILAGPLKIAFKIVSQIIGAFGFSVLDVAANAGDALVAFRDWLDSILDISGALNVIVPIIEDGLDAMKKWFGAFKASEGLKKAVEYINELGAGIKDWWAGLEDAEDLPRTIAEGIVNFFSNIPSIISTVFSHIRSAFTESFDVFGDGVFSGFIDDMMSNLGLAGDVAVELGKILLEKFNRFLSAHGFREISADAIAGLASGLREGAADVWNAAVEIASGLVQKIKDFLGIHSPSTVMAEIGENTLAGLVAGFTSGENGLLESITSIGSKLINTVKSIFINVLDWISQVDFGTLFVSGMGVGILLVINKIADALHVFNGLGDMLTNIGSAIRDVGTAFKGLGSSAKKWATSKVITSLAIAIGVLAASLFLLSFVEPKKLWSAVGAIAVLAGVMAGLAIVIAKFGPTEAADLGKYAIALVGLAGSILILAIAMKMLSGIEAIGKSIGALAIVIGAMVGVMAATKLLGKHVATIGSTLVMVASAMLIMVYVAKIAGSMDQNQLIQGGLAVAALSVLLVGLMAATKLISGSKNVGQIGGTLFKIAAAMLVMVMVAKIAGSMDRNELIQGGLAMVAFGGIIVGLMAATKLINGSKNVGAVGGSLFKIAAAMLVMILVVKIAAGMSPEEMLKGTAAIIAFGGIIVGLMAATKLINGSQNVGKIGGALLGMAAAIALMGITVALLGMLSLEHLAKGIVAVGLLGTLLAIMIRSTKGAKDCKANITAMTIAIGVMAGAIVLLSFIPVDKLASATIALSMVMGMFALIVRQSRNLNASVGPLIVMTGAIALIAGALYILATMPVENVLGSAVALSAVLLVLAGAMKIMSTLPNTINIGALVNLAAMVVAMYAVVGALALMQGVENAKENALVLGGLMAALSVMCVIVAAAGAIISATGGVALLGLGMLVGIIVLMYAVVGALAIMQNIDNAEQNALVLGGLMTVLSVLCVIIAAVGAIVFATAGVAFAGLVFLVGIIATLYLVIGALAIMQNIENAEANANLLINLLTVMGDLMLMLAVIGPFAAVGVAALAALSGLMVAFGVLATAVGVLVTKFPQIQQFLDVGIPIFEQLASGLGSVIGNFVAGFAGSVMSILPELGACLSSFMANVLPFIVGAKMIDGDVLAGVGILSAAIIALSVAEFINGVANMFSMSSSLAQLGSDLSSFMVNALPFIMGASMITGDMMSGVKALAETILILTGANIVEALTSFLTGGSSLETFATQLPILGAGLSSFAASLGTFSEDQLTTLTCAAKAIKTLAQASSDIPNTGGLLGQLVGENDLGTFAAQFPILGAGLAAFLASAGNFSDDQVATVNCAAQAIKALAQASSDIPNTGGLLGQLVGENDLGTFATQFPILGSGLANFLSNIGTFSNDQVTTVDCAAQAIKTLAQASSEIPNTGGLLAQIVGDNDLGTFAESFPVLGTALASFITNLGTFSDDQVATVTCAANAVKALAQASSDIPNTGGLLAQIVGDNDLGTFSTQLPNLGTALNGFVTNLGTFSSDQVSTVYSAVSAIRGLTDLANADLSGAKNNLTGFGDKLPGFATNVSSFCTNMPSSADMTSAVDALNDLLDAVEDIGNANSGVLSTFADNLKKVGTDAVSKFVGAFTSSTAKTDLKDAAKTLGDKVIEGIEAKEESIKTAAKNAAKKAVDGVETQEDEMKQAGKDLGSGLIKGIEAKEDAAYDAGYALGQAAVQGEKDGQASNSPSKLTTLAGKWLGEGLVIGMGKMARSVYNAGHNLGDSATNSISSTVSKIADLVNTDIDTQPTIRPVLDLSDVRSGASSINSLFGGGTSVGLLANVGSISSAMNRRNQNGVNGDVVSAIDKLSRKMDNINNAQYIIDGVTYDDGSNVANAIETIVRAAVRERRI